MDDAPSGGNPVHGLLEWERNAIVELFGAWGEVDRSHRNLAHRGSRVGLVHVSPSTLQRVLLAKQLVLPGNPPREPVPRRPWPDWLEWKPNRIWGYDFERHEAHSNRVEVRGLRLRVVAAARL